MPFTLSDDWSFLMRRPVLVVASLFLAMSLLSAAPGAAQPERIPNKVAYRVRRPTAAVGRSGSAELKGRALLRQDSVTELELTTGELDPTTLPLGHIDKVQVKLRDGSGKLVMSKEYTNLSTYSGAVNFEYAGLARGTKLDVLANVSGIDPARADVVAVSPVVKLRPDLHVEQLLAPTRALVGLPVTITAVLSEKNHDIGARASCVLSVDGTEVDRANGIWIDAGDRVSCAFTHVFDSVGAKTIRVDALDVAPHDWDEANNSATELLTVAGSEVVFQDHWAFVSSYEWLYHYRGENRFSNGWSGQDLAQEVYRRERIDGTQYYAFFNGNVEFPITRISMVEKTGGVVVHSRAFDQFPIMYRTGEARDWGECGEVYVPAEGQRTAHVQVCSYHHTLGVGQTWFAYGYGSGVVTYFSRQYVRVWHRSADGVVTDDYVYEWNDSNSEGTLGEPIAYGDTYSFDVALLSGTTLYTGPLDVPLLRFTSGPSYPWRCLEFTGDWGTQISCSEFQDTRVGIGGLVYGPQ